MKNKVEIYFPIVSDYHFEEYPFEQRKIVINEIKKIVRNGPQELSNYVNLVSINAKIEEYNQELIRHKLLQPFWGLEEDLLGFEFIVEIDLNSFKASSFQFKSSPLGTKRGMNFAL